MILCAALVQSLHILERLLLATPDMRQNGVAARDNFGTAEIVKFCAVGTQKPHNGNRFAKLNEELNEWNAVLGLTHEWVQGEGGVLRVSVKDLDADVVQRNRSTSLRN